MNIVGQTADNKMVVDGVFKMYDTSGIPLSFVFDKLLQHGMIPSWLCFYRDAHAAGWQHKTIIARLSEHIFDSYGKEFRDEVIKTLDRVKH